MLLDGVFVVMVAYYVILMSTSLKQLLVFHLVE